MSNYAEHYDRILAFLKHEDRLGASSSMIGRMLGIKKTVVDRIMEEMANQSLCVICSVPKPNNHTRYFIPGLEPASREAFILLYENEVQFHPSKPTEGTKKKKHPQREGSEQKIIKLLKNFGRVARIHEVGTTAEDFRTIDRLVNEGVLTRIPIGKIKLTQSA